MSQKTLTVEPATEAHGAQLAENLRHEDAAELVVSYGLEPLDGIRLALKQSVTAKTLLDGDRVVAILGIAPTETKDVGSIWMLTGRLAKRVADAFMTAIRAELPGLLEGWRLLVNMVWTQNQAGLRWVKSMGFDVFDAVPFGVLGELFHPVQLRGSLCVSP